ncbi:MAG: hypothetical protein ACREOI_34325 [bacterium]
MLSAYIRSARHRATYEILLDGTYYGEIPGKNSVYSNVTRNLNSLLCCNTPKLALDFYRPMPYIYPRYLTQE